MTRVSSALHRRGFLGQIAIMAAAFRGAAAAGRPPRVLLRSSWQTINIGDIAHTPGVLRLLEEHLPEVEVRLWPSKIDNGVDQLLLKRFPKLQIAADNKSLHRAFQECDFLLHGSGASFVAESSVAHWLKSTGKPFGVYGITFPPKKSWKTEPTPAEEIARSAELLSKAKFVFFRDSESLAFAKQSGCHAPVMEFGPDGAFACDLRDDGKAVGFMRDHGLEEGGFLCCIPRLRYTPTWTLPGKEKGFDAVKHARNEAMKEHDHAPLRRAIVDVVTKTDMKVLVCPEDHTQMKIGHELLYSPLPEAVKRRVVWRPDYWLTGEAVSTFTRSAGLFGNELHSAIMCIGHGIPAIICRWAEQTSKGTMWRDIGLDEWLFDLDDEARVRRVAEVVLTLATDPAAARGKAEQARRNVLGHQLRTMSRLTKCLSTG
jgi:polysaccharide pyruvyl transferase WcaK-like protein